MHVRCAEVLVQPHQLARAGNRDDPPLIKYKIVLDLLSDHQPYNEQEVYDKLLVASERFPYDRFCVLAVEINPHLLKGLSAEQQEFLVYKLLETIDAYFAGHGISLSIAMNANRIATILNYPDYGAVSPMLHELLQWCERQLGVSCNIAASEPGDMKELNPLYKQTTHHLQYAFLYGYGHLLSAERMAQVTSGRTYIDAHMINELTPLLMSGKKAKIMKRAQNGNNK